MRESIGRSLAIRQANQDIRCAAGADSTVLLTGERGVGKRFVAELIHRGNRRHTGPLVPVECLGTDDAELAAALFGQPEPAASAIPSRLEQAHKGTLLLHEASELSPVLQETMMHFLESREFPRLGSDAGPTQVDVRVVATSHLPLVDEVTAGRFREDLFYRLNTIHIVIPPLRKRRDDIQMLLEHFLRLFRAQRGRRPPRLTAAAAAALHDYDWPGNVSQLEAVAARLASGSDRDELDVEALPMEVLGATTTPAERSSGGRSQAGTTPDTTRDRLPSR